LLLIAFIFLTTKFLTQNSLIQLTLSAGRLCYVAMQAGGIKCKFYTTLARHKQYVTLQNTYVQH